MTEFSELDLNVAYTDDGTLGHYTVTVHGSRFSYAILPINGVAQVQVLHDGEPMFPMQPYDAERHQLLFADDDVLPFGFWAECDRDIFVIVLALARRLCVRLELDPAAV